MIGTEPSWIVASCVIVIAIAGIIRIITDYMDDRDRRN